MMAEPLSAGLMTISDLDNCSLSACRAVPDEDRVVETLCIVRYNHDSSDFFPITTIALVV